MISLPPPVLLLSSQPQDQKKKLPRTLRKSLSTANYYYSPSLKSTQHFPSSSRLRIISSSSSSRLMLEPNPMMKPPILQQAETTLLPFCYRLSSPLPPPPSPARPRPRLEFSREFFKRCPPALRLISPAFFWSLKSSKLSSKTTDQETAKFEYVASRVLDLMMCVKCRLHWAANRRLGDPQNGPESVAQWLCCCYYCCCKRLKF
jgi:hypothetical protein